MEYICNWHCAQIGAREHYSIPRALRRVGHLRQLYTDFWSSSGIRRVLRQAPSKVGRSLAARFHDDLAGVPVQSWNLRALGWELGLRFRWSRNGPYHGFIEVGRRFAKEVRSVLNRTSPGNAVFFAYDTGALESLEWCRDHGVPCVLNQMDPNRVEVDLVNEERGRWEGWEDYAIEVPNEYFQRREQEWALADRIVVNSEFSRKALIQQGVPPAKLVVIPLSYEPDKMVPSTLEAQRPSDRRRPLRVLWLGQVILRKGIQYLVEAARQLEGDNVRFDVVGPIGISKSAVESAPRNMIFHGRATRDQASSWYEQADVFVLPTLSDGFALTQLEAMARGLPVVTTPCCGNVVTDGVDGFIVPPRDVACLTRALLRYAGEPELLWTHRAAAVNKSRSFSMDHLAKNLLALESSLQSN